MALLNPLNPTTLDELGFVLGKEVLIAVANPADIERLIGKYYPEDGGDFDAVLGELGDEALAAEAAAAETGATGLAEVANEAPIVRFVNLVLHQAVKDRASDIHFEPFEDEFKIRYRVDGELLEITPPPKPMFA